MSLYPETPPTADPGLDESIKKLTPAQIENTINRVLTQECGARLRVFMDTCVRCGMCSDACHSYLSRDKDPNFSPVASGERNFFFCSSEPPRMIGSAPRALAA